MLKILYIYLLIIQLTANIVHAELLTRGTDSFGYRLIYDSDINITWYDVPMGRADELNWFGAMNWAEALSVNFEGTVYSNWRLPSALDQGGNLCWGYNCTGSEMGHLFYAELGNKGYHDTTGNPQTGYGLVNQGPFQYLGSRYYWSGTGSYWFGYSAYRFGFGLGIQDNESNSGYNPAIAVHPGDVALVPEPIIYDENQDWIIGDFELLNTIDEWAEGNLGDFELLDLIDYWAYGCYHWDNESQGLKPGC